MRCRLSSAEAPPAVEEGGREPTDRARTGLTGGGGGSSSARGLPPVSLRKALRMSYDEARRSGVRGTLSATGGGIRATLAAEGAREMAVGSYSNASGAGREGSSQQRRRRLVSVMGARRRCRAGGGEGAH